MKFRIVKFSENKAKKAVLNSSKIEGYKVVRDRSVKIKAHKLASKLCS
jgi:hypothetical protein